MTCQSAFAFIQRTACIMLGLASVAQAAPGDLDTAEFGSGFGRVITAIGSGNDEARSLLLQSDSKIVLAGVCANGANFEFCLARYNSDGSLDTTFNGNGKVVTAIGASTLNIGTSVAQQADGKLVVAGGCTVVSPDFCMVRYTVNGSPDLTFNGNGYVTTAMSSFGDRATGIAIQTDGKIVLAGYCMDGNQPTVQPAFCLARYDASGALDTTFNVTGMVTTALGPSENYATGIALQPDGKIVLAGICSVASANNFCVARYNPDGSLDATFNGNGKVITAILGTSDEANAVALQPDGKIVVVGKCFGSGSFDFCMARYNPNGSLDTRFNGTGKVVTDFTTSNDFGTSLTIQPDGKIISAGYCTVGGGYDVCVARYNSDGMLDGTFGVAGKVITGIGTSQDNGNGVAVQTDGKIVVGGFCIGGGVTRDFCVVRYEGGPFGARNCSLDLDGDGKVLATTDMLIGMRVALGITGSAAMGGITFPPTAMRTTWSDIRTYLVSQCGMSLPL